ncbi:MAG: PH domain-containing protein [Gaiellaceae bacterium]
MDLIEGEYLVWKGRPSWRSMISFYIRWGIPSLIPLIVIILVRQFTDQDWPIWIGIVITLILLVLVALIAWFTRLDQQFTVTSHRLIIRHGILSRREQSAHIDRVQNVSTRQTVVDRMLKVGSVDFDTAGTDDYEFVFDGVNNPQALRETIAEAYSSRISELDRD